MFLGFALVFDRAAPVIYAVETTTIPADAF